MSNFKVGQKVVCIDKFKAEPEDVFYNVKLPLINEIYTVRSIHEHPYGTAYTFEEINNKGIPTKCGLEVCFYGFRFRPLDHQFAEDVIKMICEQPEDATV